MGMLLEGKTAIITNGAFGIGEALCKRFALAGARVLAQGKPDSGVDQVVVEIRGMGGIAESLIGNIAEPGVANDMAKRCMNDFNCLNVCVLTNPTLSFGSKLTECHCETVRQIFHETTFASYAMMCAILPLIARTKGVLITLTALSAFDGQPFAGPSAAANAAIRSLAMTAAREHNDTPIRVVNVSIGPIDSEMDTPDIGKIPEQIRETLRASTLLGRYGTAEEVANAVAFLASDQSRFINGTDVVIDGGMSIAHGLPSRDIHHALPPISLDLRHQHRQ